MPRVKDMIESKFLKGDDVKDGPRLLTFRAFKRENVAMENQAPEMKWVAYFEEVKQGLVMNATNLQLAEQAMGTDDTDNWIGHPIVAYYDPNIQMQGKLVGGVRLRARKQAPPAAQQPPTEQQQAPQVPPPSSAPKGRFEDFEDDIPF